MLSGQYRLRRLEIECPMDKNIGNDDLGIRFSLDIAVLLQMCSTKFGVTTLPELQLSRLSDLVEVGLNLKLDTVLRFWNGQPFCTQ